MKPQNEAEKIAIEIRNENIIEEYQAGKGLRLLAEQFSLSQSGIRKILVNAGVYTYEFGAKENHAKHMDNLRSEASKNSKEEPTKRKRARHALIALRTERKLSQQQAADNLNLTRESYNRIENGKSNPSDKLWSKIEAMFGICEDEDRGKIRAVTTRSKPKKSPRKPQTEDAAAEPPYYARVRYFERDYYGKSPDKTPLYNKILYDRYAIIYGGWAYVSAEKRKKINGKSFQILSGSETDTRPEEMPEEDAAAIFRILKPLNASQPDPNEEQQP
ncbi:MAG: helix-turn-helix domain-containing protein [Lachnospiraceae bacterium]|jgi:DNA-binding XRE family transcriptional regulator|nr:helix-turn-helix domain-containing protein [Lachnospiraceae bacterium]